MKLQLVLKFIPELNGFLRCGRAGALLYFLLWTSATPSIRFTLTFSLNWKLAHGVLYTAQRLASFRLPVPLPCFCGAPVESLDPFFFYCPLACSVLSWLQSLMFSFSFMCPALLLHHVRFGFSSDELCATPRVLVYLLNLCKFFIWQFRNDFRFRNVPPGAVDVIAKVKSRLKCHVPVLFKRFQSSRCPRYFHRRWGARCVVASVNGSHLSIVL